MPVFLVERNFAEQLKLGSDAIEQINDITNEIGAEWLFSFLTADGKKTYCLYEAKDPQQLLEHARIVGIPADEIVEVDRFWPQASDED
jgi:hypothetical protein